MEAKWHGQSTEHVLWKSILAENLAFDSSPNRLLSVKKCSNTQCENIPVNKLM